MSSTRRKKRDGESDNYPTSDWAIEKFLEDWKDLHTVGDKWLEPAVGDGVIVEVCDKFRPGLNWTVCDIRDTTTALRRAGLDPSDFRIGSFFDLPEFSVESGNRWDVAILNPPFRLSLEFIDRCLKIADVVIVFQSLNFSGSSDRNDWIREHVPDVYVIPDRVSHTGDGHTDSVYSAWHVWGPHPPVKVGEFRVLECTPLAIRKASSRRIVQARDDTTIVLDSLFTEAPP